MSSQKIVTRFAPSPTGFLHVGGARTALFNWLLARRLGGRFLLRIEDTDLARSTQQACDQLLADLKWLGLNWDNDELVFQSKRQPIYNALIDQLIADGKAYKAYETVAELEAMRAAAKAEKREFVYRRRSITPTSDATSPADADARPHVVRFAMPVRDYTFFDVVLGKEVTLPADECQDFVIRKTDGMPTYHFAVVVDDAEMQVTHVLRGQEHTKNTFWHLALQEALGYPRPIYAHLPVIQNLDGSKMGKRDRDKKIRVTAQAWMKSAKKTSAELSAATALSAARLDVWLGDSKTQLDLGEQAAVMKSIGLRDADLPEILVVDFRRNGYLREALLNFLALLGWNPGGDREQMSVAEMSEVFSIEDIGKSQAKFDRVKLLSFNTTHAAKADPAYLIAALRDFLSANPDSPLNGRSDSDLRAVLAMNAGFRTFRDVDDKTRPLLTPADAIVYAPDAVEKVLKKNDGEGLNALREVRESLATLEPWTAETIEAAIKAFCDAKTVGLGKVAQPIRVAITGGTVSPTIGASLELLGKAETLMRVDRCLTSVG